MLAGFTAPGTTGAAAEIAQVAGAAFGVGVNGVPGQIVEAVALKNSREPILDHIAQ